MPGWNGGRNFEHQVSNRATGWANRARLLSTGQINFQNMFCESLTGRTCRRDAPKVSQTHPKDVSSISQTKTKYYRKRPQRYPKDIPIMSQICPQQKQKNSQNGHLPGFWCRHLISNSELFNSNFIAKMKLFTGYLPRKNY